MSELSSSTRQQRSLLCLFLVCVWAAATGGCGSKPATEADEKVALRNFELKEVYDLFKLHTDFLKRPPERLAQIDIIQPD